MNVNFMKHELAVMRYMYLLVRNDFTLTIVNSQCKEFLWDFYFIFFFLSLFIYVFFL